MVLSSLSPDGPDVASFNSLSPDGPVLENLSANAGADDIDSFPQTVNTSSETHVQELPETAALPHSPLCLPVLKMCMERREPRNVGYNNNDLSYYISLMSPQAVLVYSATLYLTLYVVVCGGLPEFQKHQSKRGKWQNRKLF